MKYINIDISNHPHSRKFKIKKIVLGSIVYHSIGFLVENDDKNVVD